MRKITKINEGWEFIKNGESKTVNLPHCFNAQDGLTRDYFRGECVYKKTLSPGDKCAYLYIEGANSVCSVFANGSLITTHKGGYSAFYADLTDYIKNGCDLEIKVNNSDFDEVYPSCADFTFWGGIYRNVYLIECEKTHFSFSDSCSKGVYATPVFEDGKWRVEVKSVIENFTDKTSLHCTLLDKESNIFAHSVSNSSELTLECDEPILWNGRENPYLYTLQCEIVENGKILDNITLKTGFRTFYIDSEKGFFLNGKHLKLEGVCRHQDRENMGNAITEKEHREDLDLILEVGANAIRLAHYQQSSYFYNLCDEKGILVWAEVPVISCFSADKQENAKQQLTELIKQNCNHPSIFCWGIENEITQNRAAAKDKRLVPCMKELGALVKELDNTRLSTCAQLSILDENSPLNSITDILGYNHYFGWYDFSFDFLNRWLDEFHAEHPQTRLCLSEYGAEGLISLHSPSPVQGDYSEEYQCIFHENYIKAINSRDWLWGSFVWNMFDFGVSNRHEGGVTGKNNKGLATYDRKTKKDSFYLYKAHWSNEEFSHICSERYKNRKAGLYDIKVYSNKSSVTLNANGRDYTLEGDKIFIFKDIEIKEGENILIADNEHQITIIGQAEDNPSYRISSEESFVRNWAKKSPEEQKNYLSPESTMKELAKSKDAHIMVQGKLGKDYLNTKLCRLLYPLKIKTCLKIAGRFGLSKNHCRLLKEYTYSIHK